MIISNQPSSKSDSGGQPLAVAAHQLTVVYGNQVVLRNVELQIKTGQTVAVVGINGAGKSTLLRCLAGLQRPTSGEIRWFNCPRVAAARRRVGMTTHASLSYPELSPRENLLLAARLCDVPSPAVRVRNLLAASGLQLHAERPARELSHGLRQRLAVCRALVHEPALLIMDEPFSGFDSDGVEWLTRTIVGLRQGAVATCFSTHDRQLARRLADRVVQVGSGGVADLPAQGAAAPPPPATPSQVA